MPALSPLNSLEQLSLLYPPNELCIIGNVHSVHNEWIQTFGNGGSRILNTLPRNLSPRTANVATLSNVEIIDECISGCGGLQEYFQSSLASESGPIKPENFSEIWQNISTLSELEVETISLEGALARHGIKKGWLIFEQLGAAQLLGNGPSLPTGVDVVVARAPTASLDVTKKLGLGRGDLDKSLCRSDFEFFCETSLRHPKITHLVYVRNWKNLHMREAKRLRKETLKQKSIIGASEKLLSESTSKYETRFTKLERELKQTTQKKMLHESNLRSLEKKYRVLASELSENEKNLAKIRQHLEQANKLLEMDKLDKPSKPTQATSKKRSATPRGQKQ